jgi:hypothetical protein
MSFYLDWFWDIFVVDIKIMAMGKTICLGKAKRDLGFIQKNEVVIVIEPQNNGNPSDSLMVIDECDVRHDVNVEEIELIYDT